MVTREELHHLIDELPDAALEGTARALRRELEEARLPAFLRDAPLDDEPLTEEDRAALAEAYLARAEGRTYTHEEVKRALGL